MFPDALEPAAVRQRLVRAADQVETGEPENVYSLDTTGLTPLENEQGDLVRLALSPGQGVTLPNGLGSIQLDGWSRWVKLQVGDSPGAPIALGAIAFAVLGLCLSLFVRPRRVWVRVTEGSPRGTDGSGSRVVEVGGLDRADARGGLTDDVDDLAAVLAGGPRTKAADKMAQR